MARRCGVVGTVWRSACSCCHFKHDFHYSTSGGGCPRRRHLWTWPSRASWTTATCRHHVTAVHCSPPAVQGNASDQEDQTEQSSGGTTPHPGQLQPPPLLRKGPPVRARLGRGHEFEAELRRRKGSGRAVSVTSRVAIAALLSSFEA
ncbi:hypothetical protein H257_07571 [Aphanomyces astaci]|uniref:Uncharacterized protein n=1 Tax=Aphanomyces astaci TaxID=112090 RepID=W4GHG2_APHAT|nr:hypothetical protein H257_07571 [Aphanomyces astaci]ETV78726.1 hypothetical protein H257_07571 [Aphanomyces astaci]|eukprot:XP_009831445.1 hypothetical protein H257_07571 [Aphanomyces astaci]